MTTQERDDRTATLRTWLSSLSGLALARIVTAPLEKWTLDRYVDHDGCRCLVGHAEDWRQRPQENAHAGDPSVDMDACLKAEDAFYDLCYEDGRETTIRSVQLLCEVLIATRAAAAVAALCGEGVTR